jgi:AraC-like DNA-binding protein
MHANPTNEKESFTFVPDGFPKIILVYQNNQIKRYFKTGIFTEPKEVYVPANSIVIGCRFKILAPEYLFNQSIAHLISQEESLDIDYLNAKNFDITNLDKLIVQWEKELVKLINIKKPHKNKLRLSRLLYKSKGTLRVTQVSEQIFWEQKQINRYFNQYLGISLKTYMNIQRAHNAYFDIRQGKLAPTLGGFYDQSHFIKEIKKHTGATPKEVFQNQNETFKQIKNIKKK